MLNFLKPHSYKICPDINGVVHQGGEVYPNLKITLDIEYGDSYFTYDTFTDDNGHFHFNEVALHRWTKPLALNTNVVAIRLFTDFNGVEKQLWASYIGTLPPKPFIVENLASLDCDLDEAKYAYSFENEKKGGSPYWIYGICHLKGYEEKFNQDED